MGTPKERREENTFLLKLGIAFALSFAGYLFSHFRVRIHLKPAGKSHIKGSSGGLKDELQALDSSATAIREEAESIERVDPITEPSPKSLANEDGFLLPEFNELVSQEFSSSAISLPKSRNYKVVFPVKRTEKNDIDVEMEIKGLRNQVYVLQERERNLEMQLLEYYELKEQESVVRELENRLKISSMESQLFELKIQSLQADNHRLQEQVANYSRTTAELESARTKIKLLKKRMKTESEVAKMQLSQLQGRLSALLVMESEACKENEEIQEKLQRLRDLENEASELRTSNERLQRENSELAIKLDFAETVASTSNSVHEAEDVEKALEEVGTLRETNKKLMEELERVQMDRCADVEELVYLRWINACLRYELRNFQAPPGKSIARDLNKSLSPKSEEKAKQLVLEYAASSRDDKGLPDYDYEYCSQSQASLLTDAGEFDGPEIEIQSSRRSSSSKRKFFRKLKSFVMGKESPERTTSMDRSSGTCSNWGRRRSVSKSSVDDLRASCSSFSSSITVEHYSPACSSDVGSKSLNADSLMMERITNGRAPTRIVSSASISSSSPDIRGRRLSSGDIKEYRVPKQKDFANSGPAGGILDACHIKEFSVEGDTGVLSFLEEADQLCESQGTPEKLELLRFAEVLKRSQNIQLDQQGPAFSSL
ncbi:protein CHUP1, chloroplastic-like [Nymphaea colorata]|nr:protein CHUP1, chloroplastic-like [Nymphaea colorata]